jgi:hypothetical protein
MSQALKETFQKCDRQTQLQSKKSKLMRNLLNAWLFVTTNAELSCELDTYTYSTTPVQTLEWAKAARPDIIELVHCEIVNTRSYLPLVSTGRRYERVNLDQIKTTAECKSPRSLVAQLKPQGSSGSQRIYLK